MLAVEHKMVKSIDFESIIGIIAQTKNCRVPLWLNVPPFSKSLWKIEHFFSKKIKGDVLDSTWIKAILNIVDEYLKIYKLTPIDYI